ncbi:MAG: hypothetical protein RL172_2754 [Bacteroidota bacterium]
MKYLALIQYFFYLGINWNWRIALMSIRQEINGEKKYQLNSTGADELKALKKQSNNMLHATIYMPVSYHVLENALSNIPVNKRHHFIDIGCGKGRAICVACHFGFTKVTGIEWSEKLQKIALKNLATTQAMLPKINYQVICGDAAFFTIPADADCLLLFNPFDEYMMDKVLSNICTSMVQHPREINIIYANPLYKKLFFQKGFKEVYHSQSHHYFEVSILNIRP